MSLNLRSGKRQERAASPYDSGKRIVGNRGKIRLNVPLRAATDSGAKAET
jgi:hypothetical protein